MTTHHLSDDTKKHLRKKVVELRARLLEEIAGEVERVYHFSITDIDASGLRAGLRHDREALEEVLRRRISGGSSRERAIDELVTEAASTLLFRLVLIRHLEATRILAVPLLTGGVRSPAYTEARDWLPELVGRPDDASKGFAHLLPLLYAELAIDLPGLFGDVGTTRLIPVRDSTLLATIEGLDAPELAPAWEDDTTTGWVYQFWNDAEKARIDQKIGDSEGEGTGKGKVEAHEIAPKTALYTERYMVEWLLQNSLGPMWRAICQKRGWRSEAEDALVRLAEMRAAGKVEIEDDVQDRWKYYVDVPLTEAFVEAAPKSLRDLRLLDPACGSGHFLVAAFDWLFAAWREEARLSDEEWTDEEIAAGIVENNLHGVDIDPNSVRLAAAAVYLKARLHGAHPERINLVAAHFGLRSVSEEDRKLYARQIGAATSVDPEVITTLLAELARADVLGSLLPVEKIDEKLIPMLAGVPLLSPRRKGGAKKATFLRKLDALSAVADQVSERLRALTRTDDLGVRLGAEQLEAGLRFIGMLKADSYDVVVANPPYLDLGKLDTSIRHHFSDENLYSCFLRRGMDLTRRHGLTSMVTLDGWMFLQQFQSVRTTVLRRSQIRAISELGVAAFSEIGGHITSVAMMVNEPVFTADAEPDSPLSIDRSIRFLRAKSPDKQTHLLSQAPVFERRQAVFQQIGGSPLVYWWSEEFLRAYVESPKLVEIAPSREGLGTRDDTRYLRFIWEIPNNRIRVRHFSEEPPTDGWVPFVKGAAGAGWIQPVEEVVLWDSRALHIATFDASRYGRGASYYFLPGVAFTSIGESFSGRAWPYMAIIGDKGPAFFPPLSERARFLSTLNRSQSRAVAESLNPTVSFRLEDAKRLPYIPPPDSDLILWCLEQNFSTHESHRETSVEFTAPGPSPWKYAQAWAQAAVDRPEGAPLLPYIPQEELPRPEDYLSHALGICLGRFPGPALRTRILFLAARGPDNLADARPLLDAWSTHGFTGDLRTTLRETFFKTDHLKRYENRPIHWPLSSERRSFVAWICIHSFRSDTPGTLDTLRSEHIGPCMARLEEELAGIAPGPGGGAKKGADPAAELRALVDELKRFDTLVERIARHGPAPDRQLQRAPFRMELEDGVRVNSAAMYPLLTPQWKEPAKWWDEIASGKGKTAADWSKTAARYWPARVDKVCREEPSHAVAHGCFWRYHPARAWKWELRLQVEIGPDFRIVEADADTSRADFLAKEWQKAINILADEAARRRRKKPPEAHEFHYFEPGLWALHPGAMWAAELDLIKRLKEDIHLIGPDEAPARAKLLLANPTYPRERDKLLAKVRKEDGQTRLALGKPKPAEEDED